MIRSDPGPRLPDLYEKRLSRLALLLLNEGPPQIVISALRSCSRAYYGGRLRHVWAEICELLWHSWHWYVATPTLMALCRRDFYHLDQGSDGLGCPFCGRGVPQELLDASRGVDNSTELDQKMSNSREVV